MIYSVRGKVIATEPELVVVECAGVGYACRTSFNTIQKVTGQDEVMLFTHLAVRENDAAVSILSALTPSQFALSVATGDYKALTKIKGIGTKIAQKIVLELKDKVAKGGSISMRGESTQAIIPQGSNVDEAVTALVVLGYSEGEALSAISQLDASLPVEEIIKKALIGLARF